MLVVFSLFLLTMLVIIAIAIIRSPGLFSAVMLSGIFSLLMALNFFILDAADVALTEAAVGAGVATVLMLAALALVPTREVERQRRRRNTVVYLATLGAIVLAIGYASFDQPRVGDPGAPVHQHVAPWYLTQTPELIGIPNVVTAVLGSFRGYDTLGEVNVILTAGIGVLFILSAGRTALLPRRRAPRVAASLRHHVILRVVGRVLIPFIILFGLYVQFHGEYGPGGGFQAGAIVAAAIILYALLEGEEAALRVLEPRFLVGLAAGGALLYLLVGVACMFMGGAFLDYSVLADNPVTGQQIGIIVIELGVGLAVTGTMLSIFHAFAAREQ
jgi:multicomponent Na+:H+ antiporter subunit B